MPQTAKAFPSLPAQGQVKLCEMSLRDGLQYLGGVRVVEDGRLVPIPARLGLIEALVRAGVRHIEAGSFVSPKVAPQMAATDDLGRTVNPGAASGLELSALVPNEQGFDRFVQSRFNVVATFPSANEAHCRQNFGGRSVNDVLDLAAGVAARARAGGRRLRAHVSSAFQDITSATTPSDLGTVIRVCKVLLFDHGCEYVTLADTNGTTNPARVAEVLDAVGEAVGGLARIGVHLHDRNGTGVANAYAAWEKGVRIFDSSLGGVGGSTAASRAAGDGGKRMVGNVATESLVSLFHGLGEVTGIDLDLLMTEAGARLLAICTAAGDFGPPSAMLRDRLGYGAVWRREPG